MDKWRVGDDTGSKEMDGCPLTVSEGACGDIIKLRTLDVNKTASGTTVNEGLSASSDHGIH
jgi:hypothetical protein